MVDNVKTTEDVLVPVKPAQDNYRIPFVTEPSAFMMYGESALQEFNAEVKRVEAELRRELYSPVEEEEERPARKTSACAVIALITHLLVIALLIIGRFVTIEAIPGLFGIVAEKSGLDYVLGFIDGLGNGIEVNPLITVIGVAITALFSVIAFLTSIFTIKKPTGVFMKVCLFLSFVGAVLTAVMVIVQGQENGIGLYIVIGLTFIAALAGFCSRSAKRKPTEDK